MKKILAIGNSFSQDAAAYLHDLAACGGRDAQIVNLYIGGCSLQTHWENARTDAPAYAYELNGRDASRTVSIRQALEEEDWDAVTLQQASRDSGLPDTYFPYLAELSDYVETYAPGAARWLHQTWAYETDSPHNAFARYDRDQSVMYRALSAAYGQAARRLRLPLIPCGDVIQALRETPAFDYARGGPSLCRDGFHLHLDYGRYAAAAVWYECLLDGDIRSNPYLPPAAEPEQDAPRLVVIRETVHRLCEKKGCCGMHEYPQKG